MFESLEPLVFVERDELLNFQCFLEVSRFSLHLAFVRIVTNDTLMTAIVRGAWRKESNMMKLQTRVPRALDLVIRRVQVDQDIAKGKAMRVLVDLALSHPDHEKDEFGDGDTANCTLVVGDSFYTDTKDYRAKHGLTNKSSFFKDALYRGASQYLSNRNQAG